MNVRDLIKRHEGWSNSVYKCPAGHNTIGWGWNVDANPLPDDIALYLKVNGYILTTHGEELLTISIERARADCQKLYPEFLTFTENRQAALIDWMFNQGMGNEKKGVRSFKKANAAINLGDWETAAKEMKDSKWYYQVGIRGPEIVGLIREG